MNHSINRLINNAATNPPESAARIVQTAKRINDGDIVVLESNAIKQNKTLTFTANILSLGALTFRHGKNIYGASSIVIDPTTVTCYNYTTASTPTCSFRHGLAISGETHIITTVGANNTASISITSNKKTFKQSDISWIGTNGDIAMESTHTSMKNMTLTWDCSNYSDPLWLFGDSYFTYCEERWPYYIVHNHNRFLLCGFPGAMSSEMYPDFQQALTHGTPKMAVWCLGMNDPDPEGEINPAWKAYADLFLTECKANGIIPILATVPNVPDRHHFYKNEYIRKSGCRYIDFASAVGANEIGHGWYEGMLSSDQVHPTAAGAQALANQILLDLPEIKQ